jgi:hypothetical protein
MTDPAANISYFIPPNLLGLSVSFIHVHYLNIKLV